MAFGLSDVFKTVAGPVIGGLFGKEAADSQQDSSREIAAENRAAAAEQAARNEALQREFAQHGVRWRVEDAKAAGLHPVFALTGGGAAFQNNPITISGRQPESTQWQADMGQNLGRALTATLTREERSQQDMAIAVAQSQINRNNAEANMFDAQALSMRQQFNQPAFPDAGKVEGIVDGLTVTNPAESTSAVVGDPSVAAAGDVAWKRYWITPYLYAYLPNTQGGESWAESWGELGVLERSAILAHNEQRQPGFGKRFLNEFILGKAPMPKPNSEWIVDGKWVRDQDGYFVHRSDIPKYSGGFPYRPSGEPRWDLNRPYNRWRGER